MKGKKDSYHPYCQLIVTITERQSAPHPYTKSLQGTTSQYTVSFWTKWCPWKRMQMCVFWDAANGNGPKTYER